MYLKLVTFILCSILSLSVSSTIDRFNPPEPPQVLRTNSLSVVKFNRTFYMITQDPSIAQITFPIYQSTDMLQWTPIRFVFDSKNMPKWLKEGEKVVNPQLHAVNDSLNVYFNTWDPNYSNVSKIGVAVAHQGDDYEPYSFEDIGKPLLEISGIDVGYPTVAQDGSSPYLFYAHGKGESAEIRSLQLTENGTAIADKESKTISSAKAWNTKASFPLCQYRVGNLNILFHAPSSYKNIFLTVSRKGILGPYDTLAELPFTDALYANVAKDGLGDKKDALIFSSWLGNMAKVSFLENYNTTITNNYFSDQWQKMIEEDRILDD